MLGAHQSHSSAGQERGNITKGFWVQIRTGLSKGSQVPPGTCSSINSHASFQYPSAPLQELQVDLCSTVPPWAQGHSCLHMFFTWAAWDLFQHLEHLVPLLPHWHCHLQGCSHIFSLLSTGFFFPFPEYIIPEALSLMAQPWLEAGLPLGQLELVLLDVGEASHRSHPSSTHLLTKILSHNYNVCVSCQVLPRTRLEL